MTEQTNHRLVDRKGTRALFTLSGLIAVFTLIASGNGLADPGIYFPSTPQNFISGAVSQDLISFISALGLIACMFMIIKGKNMAWLVWTGLIGYLFYAYALYCFERVYNNYFLLYLAILGLSIYSLIGFFRWADFEFIHVGSRRPPRRISAVLLLILVALFLYLWLTIVLIAMRGMYPPPANSIFVIDLSFILPLMTIEAVLLLRKIRLGDVLAVPILIKVGILGLSVLLGTLFAPTYGRGIEIESVFLYALLGLGPLALGVRFFGALDTGEG
jgi:hypothetical protein